MEEYKCDMCDEIVCESDMFLKASIKCLPSKYNICSYCFNIYKHTFIDADVVDEVPGGIDRLFDIHNIQGEDIEKYKKNEYIIVIEDAEFFNRLTKSLIEQKKSIDEKLISLQYRCFHINSTSQLQDKLDETYYESLNKQTILVTQFIYEELLKSIGVKDTCNFTDDDLYDLGCDSHMIEQLNMMRSMRNKLKGGN